MAPSTIIGPGYIEFNLVYNNLTGVSIGLLFQKSTLQDTQFGQLRRLWLSMFFAIQVKIISAAKEPKCWQKVIFSCLNKFD